VIDERVAAVHAKDAGPLAAREADDVVSFDVLRPLNARGKDAVAQKTQAWFDSYASAIIYDVDQLEIHASEDVAFCSFVYHVSGTLASGDAVSMWVRATLGLRRIDGDWRIVHDHEAVPWDPRPVRPDRPVTDLIAAPFGQGRPSRGLKHPGCSFGTEQASEPPSLRAPAVDELREPDRCWGLRSEGSEAGA
jgi:ketosteroid isomerase-like protein